MEWKGRKKWQNKDDEYYTPYEVVKEQLDPIINEIRDKKIICPCDSEWSNFYKYLKDNGCKNITLAQDFYKVNYKDYDICITNPPFSIINDFINLLFDSGIKFLIIGSWNIPQYRWFVRLNDSSYDFIYWSSIIRVKNWTNINKEVGIRWYSNVKSWLKEREKRDVEIGKKYSVWILNFQYQQELTYLIVNGGTSTDIYFYKKQQKLF